MPKKTIKKAAPAKSRKGNKKFTPKRKLHAVKLHDPNFALDTDKELSLREERFLTEFLHHWDRIRAMRAAGYNVDNEPSANNYASELLRKPHMVQALAIRRAEMAAAVKIDGPACIEYFKLVFLESFALQDMTNANRAMENVGKILGVYEKDNAQRRPERLNPEELARLKAELEMRGFDFTRRNFPAFLVGVRPDERPAVIPQVTILEQGTQNDSAHSGGVIHQSDGEVRPASGSGSEHPKPDDRPAQGEYRET